MTNTWKRLAQAEVPTIDTTIYTVPALTTTIVQVIDVANVSGATVALYINFVPSAGAPAGGNAIVYNLDISAKGVLSYTGPAALATGGFISVKGSTTGLTITVSGIEVI